MQSYCCKTCGEKTYQTFSGNCNVCYFKEEKAKEHKATKEGSVGIVQKIRAATR